MPLPASADLLAASAALGRQVAALLDVEQSVPGVTQGDPRPDFRGIAVLTVADAQAPDFNVTAALGLSCERARLCPVAAKSPAMTTCSTCT